MIKNEIESTEQLVTQITKNVEPNLVIDQLYDIDSLLIENQDDNDDDIVDDDSHNTLIFSEPKIKNKCNVDNKL